VYNIAVLYEQNLKNKEIEFINSIEPDLFVFADRSMTETIFRNLISNAIKFTNTGGKITISNKMENEIAIVIVKDTGIGIEQENIPKLFRVDAGFSTKGTKEESGTGLGLIICKELAEKQKGKIWVESKKNEGSTFYFSVPIAR
jgi:signal transduction histidine kinase